MNTSLTTLSTTEKKAITSFATRDESITMHDLYKMHYTRFGNKRTFFFATRVLNINTQENGRAFKPSEMVDDLFKYSAITMTHRLDLVQKKEFGERYKESIRRIMDCINKKLDAIHILYLKDIEYFSQESTKTEAKFMAGKIKSERTHKLYNLNTNKCT